MSSGKLRWLCIRCGHSFTRKRPDQKAAVERAWFQLWIDGYTVKQLIRDSGHSRSKLQRILLRELAKPPPVPELSGFTHVVFDGKYLFGRDFSLLVMLDVITHRPIVGLVATGENKACIQPWLESLKSHGLNPTAVTTDGRQAAIYAFRGVWPGVTTQRCLFHILLQTQAWVREKPSYESAKGLRRLVGPICAIDSHEKANRFVWDYHALRQTHHAELKGLDPKHPVQSDILKAYGMVGNALSHSFHYLDEPKIASTTSALEGYFKQIQKVRGFVHNGLTKEHLQQFIAWKIYYDGQKSHTF